MGRSTRTGRGRETYDVLLQREATALARGEVPEAKLIVFCCQARPLDWPTSGSAVRPLAGAANTAGGDVLTRLAACPAADETAVPRMSRPLLAGSVRV